MVAKIGGGYTVEDKCIITLCSEHQFHKIQKSKEFFFIDQNSYVTKDKLKANILKSKNYLRCLVHVAAMNGFRTKACTGRATNLKEHHQILKEKESGVES